MKYSKVLILTMIMMCFMVYSAYALNAVGSFNGWNNNDTTVYMYDDGTHGDAVAADKVYTCQTVIATAGNYEWKICTSYGNWSGTYPSGSNSWFQTTTASQLVKFYIDFNIDSTWSPSSAVCYTNAQASKGLFNAVGMNTWLGAAGDYDPAFAGGSMHDDGINGDATASDGIYSLRITFPVIDPSTTGAKAFKVAVDTSWTHQIGSGQEDGGSWGFNISANTKPISSINAADTIMLYCDTIKGRLRVTQSFVTRPGPPWYAIGDVQGAGLTSLTLMNDSAQNGDVTASDGIFTRSFAVTVASDSHWTSTVDEKGTRAPASSNQKGCPYSSTASQTIKAFYDSNTTLDGYMPFTKYTYTDISTLGTHTYLAVGDFQSEMGGTDWNQGSLLTQMHDDGIGGDAVSGDKIYTYRAIFPSTVTTLSDFHYKVALDQAWDMQIGGDGRSINGSPGDRWFRAISGDTVILTCDVFKGRIKAVNLNRDATPRPSLQADNGNPGQTKIFTVTGITTIIGWNSSDTSKVQILSWTGSIATVKFNGIGTATVTVYDEYGLSDAKVVQVSATDAPLYDDSMDTLSHKSISFGGEMTLSGEFRK